jgi:hypothetical protein
VGTLASIFILDLKQQMRPYRFIRQKATIKKPLSFGERGKE